MGKFITVRLLAIYCLIVTESSINAKVRKQPSVLLLPLSMGSHTQMFGRLAEALIQEGHDVTMVMSSKMTIPKWLSQSSVTMLNYYTETEPFASSSEASRLLLELALSDSFLEWFSVGVELSEKLYTSYGQDCDSMMSDDNLQEQLKRRQYDMVILDGVVQTCQDILPHKFGIPYAVYGLPFSTYLHRVPALPSFVPYIASEYTDAMTFTQRMSNLMMELLEMCFVNSTSYFIDKYTPEKNVAPMDLINNASIRFYLHDSVLSYPTPHMPNTISIGDIIITPARPLPKDLQTFMDDSQHGVILVSLGSFMNHVSQDITNKFCKTFKSLKQTIIMKHKDEEICPGVSNVKVMTWTPQNDLLAHRNLKVFITHGGFNSLMEALYHRVPMVVLPITIDQPFNAKVLETKGLGKRLSLKHFTPDSLLSSIEDVMKNNDMEDKVGIASSIIRDRLDTPGQRTSFWINHVVQHGDEHLKSSALKLNIFQFFMFDIYLFLLFCATVIFALISICSFCCLQCLCRIMKKSTKAKYD